MFVLNIGLHRFMYDICVEVKKHASIKHNWIQDRKKPLTLYIKYKLEADLGWHCLQTYKYPVHLLPDTTY